MARKVIKDEIQHNVAQTLEGSDGNKRFEGFMAEGGGARFSGTRGVVGQGSSPLNL